ncbi:membrane protein [Pullulanibacillus camelliae]|uniref:Membrane protein n=1 Tax=Pullulanibacillus camelliae TaxID=1707096 RepID=A0A8J2VMJ1_9BACL|nr:TerC family protein [Pullulanibacillus camelliae]GGE28915.1 membrane protein [Pullulanibacillus camelliae]
MDFIVGLLEIILLNIVLSGDNAVVIAMACRNLPSQQQNKAIFWGSFGAIILRIILTFIAVGLLELPYLKIIGGLLLIYIAVNLIKGEDEGDVKASASIIGAIRTIVIADLIMSLDNVVAVAGAAHNNILLIIIGLAVSIPLIVWGSQMLMKLMQRFPIIIILGAALLGYTSGEMITEDDIISDWLDELGLPYLKVIISLVLAVAVVGIGKALEARGKRKQEQMKDDK